VYAGAFYWDSANDAPETGIGYKWDSSGWEFFVRSDGSHIGPSPISQEDWKIDSFDGDGNSGEVIDPSDGHVYNWPHTWYNEGPLSGALLNSKSNQLEEAVRAVVNGRPSTKTPNLPVQLVVRNAGTATELGVQLGGVQYSTYGASREDLERRQTPETRIETGGYLTDQRTLTNNAVDPSAEPGKPIVSVQRETDRSDLNLRVTELDITPISDDIWVFAWDEYDPGTALTGATFNDPTTPNNSGKESHVLTDTQATGYTPTTAVFRGAEYFVGDKEKEADLTETDVDIKVPLGATRVYTGVNETGTAADLRPFKATIEEGY